MPTPLDDYLWSLGLPELAMESEASFAEAHADITELEATRCAPSTSRQTAPGIADFGLQSARSHHHRYEPREQLDHGHRPFDIWKSTSGCAPHPAPSLPSSYEARVQSKRVTFSANLDEADNTFDDDAVGYMQHAGHPTDQKRLRAPLRQSSPPPPALIKPITKSTACTLRNPFKQLEEFDMRATYGKSYQAHPQQMRSKHGKRKQKSERRENRDRKAAEEHKQRDALLMACLADTLPERGDFTD